VEGLALQSVLSRRSCVGGIAYELNKQRRLHEHFEDLVNNRTREITGWGQGGDCRRGSQDCSRHCAAARQRQVPDCMKHAARPEDVWTAIAKNKDHGNKFVAKYTFTRAKRRALDEILTVRLSSKPLATVILDPSNMARKSIKYHFLGIFSVFPLIQNGRETPR